ncbi:MAG: MerR family transcriptional regulator [Slackia sp.]|nr:MerR family transcriptional regulator [Slackia sp.]
MKHTLLSIGEVSRMKGVSPKSLRYYEQLGILKPARVDPHSGYRYYAMNQMIVVDVIVTCIELGIPLKTLTDYIGENGTLDIEALLAEGRAKAIENIRRARLSLAQIDRYLEEAGDQERLKARAQPSYLREIGSRPILFSPWEYNEFDARRYLSLTTDIYEQAKASHAMPLYQWGMARSPIDEGGRWCVFVETAAEALAENGAAEVRTPSAAHADEIPPTTCLPNESESLSTSPPLDEPTTPTRAENAAGTPLPDNNGTRLSIARIPAGTYRGRRIREDGFESCFRTVFEHAESITGAIVAAEVWDAEMNPADYVVELLERQ